MALIKESTIPFPEVDLNTYKPKDPIEVPIVKSEIATATSSPNFVRHIEFDVSGTDLENRVIPGQALGVVAEGKDENGRPHKVRLYSICSPTGGEDGEGKIYATTVKRVIDEHWDTQELYTGDRSNYLCSKKEGDKIMMTGPSGKRFILPENQGDFNYVFLATGTGIFRILGLMGLFDYMRIDDELREMNPLEWSRDQLKGIKAGERMFLEVY